MSEWYPSDKKELNSLLDSFLAEKQDKKYKKITGIIVPHAGYAYSGKIAGKAYSLLRDSKNKEKTAVLLSPSHYSYLKGVVSHNQKNWKTPLGATSIAENEFPKISILKEHAIDNQIPFIQKIGFENILPLMIGEISLLEAKQIAEKISKIKNAVFIVSSDLSHFLNYEEALKKDKNTISHIKNLESEKILKIENSACGIFPLLIAIELCKIKKIKPKLLEYRNSGDLTGDKSRVVGYASFIF